MNWLGEGQSGAGGSAVLQQNRPIIFRLFSQNIELIPLVFLFLFPFLCVIIYSETIQRGT